MFFALVWGLYGRKRVFVRDVAKMRTTPGGRFRGSGVTGWSPGVGITGAYKPFGEPRDYDPETAETGAGFRAKDPHGVHEGMYMGHMGTGGGGY